LLSFQDANSKEVMNQWINEGGTIDNFSRYEITEIAKQIEAGCEDRYVCKVVFRKEGGKTVIEYYDEAEGSVPILDESGDWA
jgi:hypothetical protein